MKKLLLVGGGHSDIPLIRSAKRLGYRVITSGNRSKDLGHSESDAYIPCDFSDPQEVLELARSLEIDAHVAMISLPYPVLMLQKSLVYPAMTVSRQHQ